MLQGKVLRLVESQERTFQDFPELDSPVAALDFVPAADRILVATGSEIQIWKVLV
jgi:hypothetical protein